MLVNCPRKLIIQLPRNGRHDSGEESDDARDRNQIWFDIRPYLRGHGGLQPAVRSQSFDRFVDLVVLNRSIDEHSNIIDAKSDDLNGILQSQRIVDKDQLVEESEDE